MSKGFKIVMMSKEEIKIDSDEIPKVLEALTSGNPCVVRQGIFNPKVYSHIIRDEKREMEKEVNDEGHYTGKYISAPLQDIFEGVEALVKLKTEELKKLN